jgi:predicted O-methyltransferase YrrM
VPELRESLEGALEGVDGWFNLDEAWVLHEAVRTLPARQALTVVEIGSWKGRSAITMGLGLKARGRGGRVITIDPHETGEEADVPEADHDRMPELVANIEGAGLGETVEAVRAFSHEARPRFEDGSVDLLFVDGSHHYEDVLQDIDDWRTALRAPAVVAFNDSNWAGVNRALRERVAVRAGPFRNPAYVFNTLFFEFAPQRAWRVGDTVRLVRLRLFLRFLRLLERVHNWASARGRGTTAVETAGWLITRALLPRPRL